jgi:hypothetical protein
MSKKVQTPANGYDMLKLKEKTAKKRYCIGIDPGTSTGFAIWDTQTREFISLETVMIHKAFDRVQATISCFGKENIHVRYEDARLRNWFGTSGREKLQGAGSIKRDSTIWEDYLQSIQISFEKVAPKSNKTKMDAEPFNRLTRYKGRSSEHARDAAMLVFGM